MLDIDDGAVPVADGGGGGGKVSEMELCILSWRAERLYGHHLSALGSLGKGFHVDVIMDRKGRPESVC